LIEKLLVIREFLTPVNSACGATVGTHGEALTLPSKNALKGGFLSHPVTSPVEVRPGLSCRRSMYS
jgi:hypothetical protein